MGLADRLAKGVCLVIAVVCTTAEAQQPPPHPDAGKTAYYCDRNGSMGWQVEPCSGNHRMLRTGRVRDNGTIQDDSPPPVIDLRPEAERNPSQAPVQATPSQPVRSQAAPSPQAETHRFGYIKQPWAWLLGFALAFGLVGKMLGRSFTRWAIVGALTEFVLVGLDRMPLK